MTGKRITGASSGHPPADLPDQPRADSRAYGAATREAKGSVHEAIGKLMGDDIARDHGTAEKRAGAIAARKKPRR